MNDQEFLRAAFLAALPAVIRTYAGDTLSHGESQQQMFVRKSIGLARESLAQFDAKFPQHKAAADEAKPLALNGLTIGEVDCLLIDADGPQVLALKVQSALAHKNGLRLVAP
jgi:hypothetical protein